MFVFRVRRVDTRIVRVRRKLETNISPGISRAGPVPRARGPQFFRDPSDRYLLTGAERPVVRDDGKHSSAAADVGGYNSRF